MNWLIFISAGLVIFSLVAILIDLRKIKNVRILHHPMFTVIIPTYNDGKTIEKTIESITDNYPNNEIFIVDDCSSDGSEQIIKQVMSQSKGNIKYFRNQTNLGKSESVNSVLKQVNGEVILILDSDMVITKENFHEMIVRLSNPKVGGVSCRYKVLNCNNFLTKMQDVEYCSLAYVHNIYNIFSSTSMWGGCMAFKKEAFLQIGGLDGTKIIEDGDAALKLQEKGWKVQQTYSSIYTNVPFTFKSWWTQKIRWGSGWIQNLFDHWKIYLRNPICIIFGVTYILSMILFIRSFFNNFEYLLHINLLIFADMGTTDNIVASIVYPFLSLLQTLYDQKYRGKNILMVIPYLFIYMPLFSFVSLVGFITGIKRYPALKRGERAW